MTTFRIVSSALVALSLLVLTCIAAPPQPPTIDTVAGTGAEKDNGDAGVATRMNVGNPFGVEFGPDGALYICEVSNHRVRRLDLQTGKISTVAGTGKKGYSGDGGPATDANLNEPYEVRFDTVGNMYFVEMQNHIVRRVDAKTGTISTVAGTGEPGYSGDGGLAKKAQFHRPHSIALDDQGDLYIADIQNHRIRRVDLASGQVESIAGSPKKSLPRDGAAARGQPVLGPRALAYDDGRLWVALREGHSLWYLDLADDTWRHVAGTGKKGYSGDGGPAAEATMNGPKGVALDKRGRIYVVDTENQAIRVVDPQSGTVDTLAGSGPKQRGGGGDGGPARHAQLARPHGICVGPNGAVYIGDSENHRVRRVTPLSVPQ